MTAQKVLDIGKAGATLIWKLVVFIGMSVFVIVAGFFKLWAFLGDASDNKEVNNSWPTSETQWDLENPNANPMEKGHARDSGHFF